VPASPAPPVPAVPFGLDMGGHTVDLTTRAVVVAVVPPPRFARDSEVLAAVRAAALAGADLVEVPAEPRLLGPAAAADELPVAARVGNASQAAAAWAAGARLLLVAADELDAVVAADSADDWQIAVVVGSAREGRETVAATSVYPVALDSTPLAGVDAVSEESLALAVGVRVMRTTDIRRTRRVVEVMAHLLEARR